MNKKLKESIRIQEAMNNLAALVELDTAGLGPIGVVQGTRIVTNEEEFPKGSVAWLSAEGSEAILEQVDLTYEAVLVHLQSLISRESEEEDEEVKEGILALMSLVAESADQLDAYLTLRNPKSVSSSVKKRSSFVALQEFYRNECLEGRKSQDSAWGEAEKEIHQAFQSDREYELFSLSTEEGQPYYDPARLQNVRLTLDFETDGETFEEDPLLKVRAMLDRDLHATARQILDGCMPYLHEFFHAHRKFPDHELASSLSKAILALFLAADGRHLIQNTTSKSCLSYFKDFHRFLRRSLKTEEYQKWIAYPPDRSEIEAHLFLFLTHLLCRSFFTRPGGVKQELIGLIHRSTRKGEEIEKAKGKKHARFEKLWPQLLADDASLRTLLAKFPDGPLFKILDTIREQKEFDAELAFDPIAQDNFPAKLYDFRRGKKMVHVLRIPSPTRQGLVQKAFIVDEFKGFLRSLDDKKQGKLYLLVNLQDRQVPHTYSRIKEIETIAKSAEFKNQIALLSLPKDTQFYYQNGPYLKENRAENFLKAFENELFSKTSGYQFPTQWKEENKNSFLKNVLQEVHKNFFGNKKELSRKEREDFIEFVHHLVVLKVVEELEVDLVSFTCKDAVDTGAAFSASFYVFTRMQEGSFGTKEEMDHLRWLLYFPALLVRERVIDGGRLIRTVSFLERLN